MPIITLPDGTEKQFDKPVTIEAVAASIGAGLAKAALAGEVDGQLVDTRFEIDHDAKLRIITARDEEGLDIIRHSTAHLLAQAVKQLFPEAQVTIGPVIDDGFYYDFAFSRSFTPEDLEKIEARMNELAKKAQPVSRVTMTRDEAIRCFEDMGEHYKVEIIKAIPENEVLSAYKQGDFIDLCRGPHVPNTQSLKAFTLTKLAGAYWRGDSNNEMLQRIYGTAWGDKKELKAYLHRIEEAKKRDHRELAKKMDLFHMQPDAPGMIFWHQRGWQVIRLMRDYMRGISQRAGFEEVNTPIMMDVSLWEQSGHRDKFGDEMFILKTADEREHAIKPMNCPCHVQIFNQGVKSYRDLPVRYAEFGHVHRNEPSGTLHGLMRLRGFVQDDSHVFCTEDQIQQEVLNFINQLHQVYADFGFDEVIHKLSTRPEKRVGNDTVWDKAEQALAQALNTSGVEWEELPGEGAFYGPKIEFSLKDCLGRVWQCGTIQVDFSMPDRLNARYVAEDGSKQVPVMLHRATLGSTERFLGILLEEYAGKLPAWLAPVQVVVMGVADRHHAYVEEICAELQKTGIRAIRDLRNEKIGFKIREHTIARIPYMMVLGDREVEQRTVTVRVDEKQPSQTMTVERFIASLQDAVNNKRRVTSELKEHA